MSKQKMTTIDPAKLRAFVEEKGDGNVTKMIGKANGYFYNIYDRKKIPAPVLNAMCAIYGKKPSEFKPDPPKPKPTVAFMRPALPTMNTLVNRPDLCGSRSMPSVGYALDLQVYPDFVHLRLVEDSKVIKQAKGKIKKEGVEATKLEIMQAISCAAHMIYKFAEQDEIG